MHVSLWYSDTLHTLKPGSCAVSLQHVPYCLTSLFSPPVCNTQASSLHTQETIQMNTRSPTQNYKTQKICLLKVQNESRNIEQFNKPLATACKSEWEKPLSLRTRMKGRVSCGLCCSQFLVCHLNISLRNQAQCASSRELGRKGSPSSLASKSQKTQCCNSKIHLATYHGEVEKDPTDLSTNSCTPPVPSIPLSRTQSKWSCRRWFGHLKI